MRGAYALLIGPFETFGFMRTALIACLALALANGPIGILLILRRMSLKISRIPIGPFEIGRAHV